jgi:hypothetical protein
MPDASESPLRPVSAAELRDALAASLHRQRQRTPHAADDLLARLAAEAIASDLDARGFVVLSRHPSPEAAP